MPGSCYGNGTVRMSLRLMQLALVLSLAACGSSAQTSAQSAQGSGASSRPANLSSSTPPVVSTPVANFDEPWALAFLPGSSSALVTEKPGRIWLVDVRSGAKQPVAGAPAVAAG